MVTDIVESSVAVKLPLSSHAIILSLPRSSFELIPLIIATTQEHWGSDQVIFKDNTWWRIRALLELFQISFRHFIVLKL